MDGALHRIAEFVERRQGGLIATINPEIVMHARRDPGYAAVLESAQLTIPDGAGVVWALRRRGCATERVTGTDLVLRLPRLAAEQGWRIFLLGAGEGIAAHAARVLAQQNPGFRAAGVHSGSPDPADDETTWRLLEDSAANIVLVAYGFPNQERWIARMHERLPFVIGIGVGGAFDFVAGAVPRAPAWMRRVGAEWVFRLAVQPWRARRMAVLPVYAVQVLRERRET